MSNTRQCHYCQNIIVVLGRQWRDGLFYTEPAQCLEEQINNTVIISTPDASNLNDTHMLDLMALTFPGPHLFLVRLEEGKQPDRELGKWEKIFGEDIFHNMIYITDGRYDNNNSTCISINEDIIKQCEQIIKDKHFTYSFREFRMRKPIENKMGAEMETDQTSSPQVSPSPVPGGQQKSQQLTLELLEKSGSGKGKPIKCEMGAEMETDQSSSPQDVSSPVPGVQRKSPQLTLVLLGESGSGKSASGNTIMGEKAFTSKPSSMPVTTKCETWTKSICGTEVTVIDTPDFFDDSLEMQSTKHIQRCKELCDGGLCVYLLAIQIGRFTEGERDILERLEKALQPRVRDRVRDRARTRVRNRVIILFTHGDDLESEIDDYVTNTNQSLQKLIGKCGRRYQVISNTTSHKTEAVKQVKELMGKIVKLVQTTDGVTFFPEYDAEKSPCV